MLTRVRIEAEGGSTSEVEDILTEVSVAIREGTAYSYSVVGPSQEALANAQVGEFVIERSVKDLDNEPGHGAIYYRGRMTTHYARRYKPLSLSERNLDAAPSGSPPSVGYDPKTGHATVTTTS